MTDISIDDMITARTEARPDFKKAYRARQYTSGIEDLGGFGNRAGQQNWAAKYGTAALFDPIAPPTEIPLSDDPRVAQGQLAQAAYKNTFDYNHMSDTRNDMKKEAAIADARDRDPQNIDAARRAKGTAMDVKGGIRYGALGDQYPDARMKIWDEDLGTVKKMHTASPEGEDFGTREKDDGEEIPEAPASRDEPTPAPRDKPAPTPPLDKTAQTAGKKQPKRKQQRVPPSMMDKGKMAERAAAWQDRHLFKSEGTDIDAKIYSNQFEKAYPARVNHWLQNYKDLAEEHVIEDSPYDYPSEEASAYLEKLLSQPRFAVEAAKILKEAQEYNDDWEGNDVEDAQKAREETGAPIGADRDAEKKKVAAKAGKSGKEVVDAITTAKKNKMEKEKESAEGPAITQGDRNKTSRVPADALAEKYYPEKNYDKYLAQYEDGSDDYWDPPASPSGPSDYFIYKSEGADIDAKIYSNQFEKGGQPVREFSGRADIAKELAREAGNDAADPTDYDDGQGYWNAYNEEYDAAMNDPQVAIQAYRNKHDALGVDAFMDGFNQFETEWNRNQKPNITPNRVMNEIGAEKPYEKTRRGTRSDPDLDDLTEEHDPVTVRWAAPGRGERARRAVSDINALIGERQERE